MYRLMTRAGMVVAVIASIALLATPAAASHTWVETRTDSDAGCDLVGGVTTCTAFASITVSSGPGQCLGSPGSYTACRASVSCTGSGSSNLAASVNVSCSVGGASGCAITGTTGGGCSASPPGGFTPYVVIPAGQSEACITLAVTTTTTNPLGTAQASRSIRFCADITGSHFH